MKINDFAVFILTNNRPDKVYTYSTLRRCGYTGKIFLILDNQDKSIDQYRNNFKEDEIIIFNKDQIAKTFDQGDNFNDKRAIIYARNASFEIAENLKIKYFLQLDDDYQKFDWRFNSRKEYSAHVTRSLDDIFKSIINFYISCENITSIAIAQGGDFIGGNTNNDQVILLKRKAMNSFFCCIDRKFNFVGRINEDVNTYTNKGSQGLLFFTINQVSLTQKQTQTNSGGMTELYLDSGTYLKSFYSVMYQPSSVKITIMNTTNSRLHHKISWKNTVPLVIKEEIKKS